jgi:hypothetical protein
MTLDIFENDLFLADKKSASLIKLNKLGRKSSERIYHGVNDVSLEPRSSEVYSIHYVTKFVSDLQQVGSFLQFPPPIELPATI